MSKERRRVPVWLRILLIVLAVLLLLGAAGGIFVLSRLGRINRAEQVEALDPELEYFETDATEPSSESAESEDPEVQDVTGQPQVMDPEDVVWSDAVDVYGTDNIINILLIGQDARKEGERARSDAMILATVNKTDQKIILTSLMRDMYVQIPGYSDNRINAAYAFGGTETLDETIRVNFDIEVDGNIELDFSGFCDIIDFIGGIRGLRELEQRAETDMRVAFSMHPTSMEELLSVADAGRLMPPKSTWFEPKLRSGLFIHRL